MSGRYVHFGSLAHKAKTERCGDAKYPVLSVTKGSGVILQSERFKKQVASVDTSKYLIVRRGQLVFTIHLDQGVLGIQDIVDAGIVSPAYKVWDIDTAKVNPQYLLYALKSERSISYFANCGQSTVAGRSNVSDNDLKKVSILLPDYENQIEVVRRIQRLESLIRMEEEYLSKSDELVKSRFVEMFGDSDAGFKWDVHPVGEHASCMVPGRDKPKSFSGDIPWITIDDLVINGVTFESTKGLGLSLDEIAEVRRKPIPAGSVILSCVGRLGICSIAGRDMVINQQLHSFQCGSDLNNIYLMHALGMSRHYMEKKANTVTVAYMKKETCNSIPIPIPPFYLQQEFANFVQQVDKSRFAVQQAIEQLETLKASLMQECFG